MGHSGPKGSDSDAEVGGLDADSSEETVDSDDADQDAPTIRTPVPVAAAKGRAAKGGLQKKAGGDATTSATLGGKSQRLRFLSGKAATHCKCSMCLKTHAKDESANRLLTYCLCLVGVSVFLVAVTGQSETC